MMTLGKGGVPMSMLYKLYNRYNLLHFFSPFDTTHPAFLNVVQFSWNVTSSRTQGQFLRSASDCIFVRQMHHIIPPTVLYRTRVTKLKTQWTRASFKVIQDRVHTKSKGHQGLHNCPYIYRLWKWTIRAYVLCCCVQLGLMEAELRSRHRIQSR